MESRKAGMVFADLPYNVPIAGNVIDLATSACALTPVSARSRYARSEPGMKADRRFAVTRWWSRGDSNHRSSLRSVYSGKAGDAGDFNAVFPYKTAQRSFLRRHLSGRRCRKRAGFELSLRRSNWTYRRMGPAVRIPSAPATSHCEPRVTLLTCTRHGAPGGRTKPSTQRRR